MWEIAMYNDTPEAAPKSRQALQGQVQHEGEQGPLLLCKKGRATCVLATILKDWIVGRISVPY